MGERDQPTRRMEELAASAVEVAEQLLGKPLDFTPESLAAVDELLGVLRPAAQGPPSEEAELAAGVAAAAGAYVGECLRRACGGAWTEGESGGPEAGPRLELADLRLDVLAAVASIGRGQALDLGDTTADSVEDLYQHLLQHHGAWFIGTYARLPDGLERALPEVADSPELALSVLQEAARAVYWASAEHGVVLDFSEESVGRVEGILATLHGKVRAGDEEAARLAPVEAAAYGSYLGEVLRRARGGAWARIEHEGQPLIVVRVDGARVNPMAVAHQRLVQGEEHDVVAPALGQRRPRRVDRSPGQAAPAERDAGVVELADPQLGITADAQAARARPVLHSTTSPTSERSARRGARARDRHQWATATGPNRTNAPQALSATAAP